MKILNKVSAVPGLWSLFYWRCFSCENATKFPSIEPLSFTPGSNIGIFFALAVPIQVSDKSVSMSFYFEANYGVPTINTDINQNGHHLEKRSIDRGLLYNIIERKLESNGYPGRACLLRTICESAKFPFLHNGLVGDIIRIIFTPSTSQNKNLHPEIEEVEYTTDCSRFYEKCSISLLDIFSDTFEN